MPTSKPKYSYVDHRIIGLYFPWIMSGHHPTSSPLEQKLRVVQEVGYDGVAISWWDAVAFYNERGDLGQIKELSAELDLPLAGYTFMIDNWGFCDGPARENALLLAKTSVDLAHAAGCQYPCLVGSRGSGDLKQAAGFFRELAQHAGELGINLGLEYDGMTEQMNNLKVAWEVLELVDEENTGVALDSYHFFAGGSDFKDLEAFPTEKIYAVHLADGPADLTDPAIDYNRVMPGEGELPLGDLVRTLGNKGYDGFWHVECIQGRDYASDMAEVAARGLRTMKNVVETVLST